MSRLLHLSDLHFGTDHYFRQGNSDPQRLSLSESLLIALEGNLSFDAVVISGDILTNNAPKDRALAEKEINALIDALALNPNRVFIVPGNHDLTWDRDFPPFHFYDQTLEGCGISSLKSGGIPELVPLVSGDEHVKPTAVLLLNSSMIEGEATAGLGRISDKQLRRAEQLFAKLSISPDTHEIIAVLHHHLLPIWPSEPILDPGEPHSGPIARPSITVDAVETLRKLSEWGVSAVLHGHQHRHAVLTYTDHYRGENAVHILAAGSVGEKNSTRQFFVYELRAGEMIAESYEQSVGNSTHFKKAWQRTLTLRPPRINLSVPIMDSCKVGHAAIAAIQLLRPNSNRTLSEEWFESDLHYLFLTVTDCEKARRLIRQFVLGYRPNTSQFYLKLNGMFDLLGKWDLAVRFRAGGAVAWPTFVSQLEQQLEHASLLFKNPQDNSVDWFDIKEERAELSETSGFVTEESRFPGLASTYEYEKSRSQKGFLYIELPPKPSQGKRLLNDLRSKVSKSMNDIIQAVCVSPNAVILELYMTCPQTVFVNALNREVGPILASFDCQKYTLLCYEYDEAPVASATPILVKNLA